MAILALVIENERIIDRHLRDIIPALLDYDASENQSTLSVWSKAYPGHTALV